MSDIELQELLDFDHEEIEANRHCILSPRQEKRIREAESLNSRLFIGTGILLILIAVGNAFGVISSVSRPGNSLSGTSQNDMTGLVIGIGAPGLLLGFFAWGAFKMAANRVDHSVQQARGRVRFVRVDQIFSEKSPNGLMVDRTAEAYELQVGKVKFENINPKIMDIIEDGDLYAFYYTKEAKDILSAEQLAKGT